MRPSDEEPLTLQEVARGWREGDPGEWSSRPGLFLAYGRRALELGDPELGFDILKAGLRLFPGHPEMTYRAALGLARGGATRDAWNLLAPLLDRLGPDDPLFVDASSLAGRIEKDRWSKQADGDDRRRVAAASAERYRAAFEATRDHFPGINAATMYVVAGRADEGRTLATAVREICRGLSGDDGPADAWVAATLGEACLLLGEHEESARWYRRAVELAGPRFGDVASMRRQVLMLASVIDVDEAVEDALRMPAVVAFTGHMIDAPERPTARFPPAIEAAVAEAIAGTLDRLGAGFGYCSAASGGDLLFVEAMLARGGEVHVLLPFGRDEFVRTSVAPAGEAWTARFHAALERATTVRQVTSEGYLGDDSLFAYTNDLVAGAAILRARQLETEIRCVAALDATADGDRGGAAETAERWRRRGAPLDVVDLARLRRESGAGRGDGTRATRAAPDAGTVGSRPGMRRQVKTMLFADVVGFSGLGEAQAPSFFADFMGHVAGLIRDQRPAPAFCNTWGDGLFVVFDDLLPAADFALRLRDTVRDTDWPARGLPAGLSIRIGMHAGPVYPALDPILDRTNFFGTHVNLAARIEPVTAPGSVFLSDQAACLLAATGSDEVACDYLGFTELAKKFGGSALYRLRRAGEID